MTDYWEGDRLGYKSIGETFTNLIKSIDTDKVISIEAGFGRGKTFFRKAWANHLRAEGEVVVEIDVQQSDHSGDPVITVLGAFVEALPNHKKGKAKSAFETAKKIGAVGAKTVARALLKSGADELIEVATDKAIDALDDFDALDEVVKDLGKEMSKIAGQVIASQMAAEKVRKVELPQQLDALRMALVEGSKTKRVVVIVDELDRCHPEYAISFLESMKLVFSQSGFVFCLMMNASYLENLARHRYGVPPTDEKYLDKFVDIRLQLAPIGDAFKIAILEISRELPLSIPFGNGEKFSVNHAAQLASELAVHLKFSMRKTKRILLKVEVALRCYSRLPLDASLLVFLAFQDESGEKIPSNFLTRSLLSPEEGEMILKVPEYRDGNNIEKRDRIEYERMEAVRRNFSDLLDLPIERYNLPDSRSYREWALVFNFLAPYYIPIHRDVLNGVAVVVNTDEGN